MTPRNKCLFWSNYVIGSKLVISKMLFYVVFHWFVKKEPFILGKTLSYIRGCSSGSADTSIPEVRNFSLKNKDRCRYYPHSKDHILACVTWCDSNFCNGPLDFDKFPKLMVTTSACSRPLLHTFIIFLLSFFIISERYTFKMCS